MYIIGISAFYHDSSVCLFRDNQLIFACEEEKFTGIKHDDSFPKMALDYIYNHYKITNKNPLGSAAGYGSSFPLNRTLTTELLGFDTLNYNVVYAQMGRGKVERIFL